MNIKKQILLPKSSFALANDEDVFINLQLNKTYSDIKNEKISNIFDVNVQFDSERQSSLKFCIYGLVESLFANSGNLIIDVKESLDLNFNLPKISSDSITGKTLSIRTFELTLDSNGMSKNLYGKTKSAYSILFEIDKNELDAQDAQTISNGGVPKTRNIEFTIINVEKNIFYINSVPYLFYDSDGNRVKFGSQTSDVDDDGNIIEIDNDFPFLYDRHWIKQYFNLPAPSYVFFPDKVINAQESTFGEIEIAAGLSAATITLNIALDQKSPYGLEEATVILDVDNTSSGIIITPTVAGQGKDTGFVSPPVNQNKDYEFVSQTVKWNVGEQYKTFNLTIIDDKYVEGIESLTFKISDFKYCIPKSDEDIRMKVEIIDDDIPSQIRFLSGSTTIKSNASAITVSYVFNKPLEVPNQSITLAYSSAGAGRGDGSYDAIVGKNFILDVNNPSANTINVNFNQGDISGSTSVIILDNDVYDVEKTFRLAFINPSQNIVVSNIGSEIGFGQMFSVTIKDSINTQFSSFIFVNNPDKKIGAVRSFKTPDLLNRYRWNSDSEIGFGTATSYDIQIFNKGEDIVRENKLIKSNSLVETIKITGQQLTDIVIDLPSNILYDKPNKKYKKSKYKFTIVSNETFQKSLDATLSNDFSIIQSYDYSDIVIETEKDAGPSGSLKYYFTTKLINFYLNYNKIISACTIDGSFNTIDYAYTNNVVFKGFYFYDNTDINSTNSLTNVTFENSKIPSYCSQFYPFGFEPLPNPPYNFNYININFRNVYPQSVIPLVNEYNNLKFDEVTVHSDKKGFLKWEQSSLDTRHSLSLSVVNNGDIAVEISGQTIAPGEKISIRGYEQELNDFSIILPTNESFVKSKSGFTFANYILSVDNVSYYSQSGSTVGNPVSFKFESTNNLASGQLNAIPQYFIVSEYSKMYVPFNEISQNSAQIDCFTGVFDNFNTRRLIDIAVKGLLLPNSNSGFKRGYFVGTNNDLQLTCFNESIVRFPFKRLL